MRFAHVSIIALAVALGAPALAQQTGGATATTPAAGAQRIDADQLKDRLGQVGVEDRKEFKGKLVRAESPEGHPVLMVIGPENMEGDKSLDDFSQDNVRGKLTQSGFRNIQFIDNAQVMRGKMGDEKAILAMAGDQGWRGTPGAAQGGTPNRDRLTEQLGNVGLEDREEFKGKLVRAHTSEGQTLFVLVGPENFEGDSSVEFSATDLTKFQQGGFPAAEVVQDVTLVRGKMNDMAVIALAGRVITEPASTGAIGSGGATGASPTPNR